MGGWQRTSSAQCLFFSTMRYWTRSYLSSCIKTETIPTSTSVTAGSCWILKEVRSGWVWVS